MKFLKEVPVILIVAIPFIYLAYIWNTLPEQVPLHWNIKGEIDRYGSKYELWLIPILLPLLIYIIFLIVPSIDPKKNIHKMGNKYQNLKVLMTLFMSALAIFIIYYAKNQTIANPNYIVLIMGILFIIIGNYFKTLKANYFIGIKTPWTLENETVWKKTHNLAGKLWFSGGFLIMILSLVLNKELNFKIFAAITIIISIIPILYSYFIYKNIKQK